MDIGKTIEKVVGDRRTSPMRKTFGLSWVARNRKFIHVRFRGNAENIAKVHKISKDQYLESIIIKAEGSHVRLERIMDTSKQIIKNIGRAIIKVTQTEKSEIIIETVKIIKNASIDEFIIGTMNRLIIPGIMVRIIHYKLSNVEIKIRDQANKNKNEQNKKDEKRERKEVEKTKKELKETRKEKEKYKDWYDIEAKRSDREEEINKKERERQERESNETIKELEEKIDKLTKEKENNEREQKVDKYKEQKMHKTGQVEQKKEKRRKIFYENLKKNNYHGSEEIQKDILEGTRKHKSMLTRYGIVDQKGEMTEKGQKIKERILADNKPKIF